jgi:foldase protein PrsA
VKKTMRMITALGAFFVVGIVVAACGSSSSVPAGDVAVVAGNPISTQAFNHWMYVADKGNALEQGSPVIVPTDPPNFTGCIAQIRSQIPTYAKTPAATLKADCKELFTSLDATVMDFLVKAYWYQGTAYKDGIKVTAKELTAAFKTAQQQEFPTTAEYNDFLEETGETRQDIDFRLRVNTVFQKLIAKHVPKLTPALISKYYNAHLSSFSTPESRNVEIIQTADTSTGKRQIAAAEAALKSGESWATVAKKYSTNAATKSTGGVLKDLTSEQEEAAVSKVIFAAPVNQLKGPVKGTFGYYLVEVQKINPATKTSLTAATKQIKSTLTTQYDNTAETTINAAAKKQWGSETRCKALYSMADCAGYVAPKTTTTAAATTPAAAATATSGAATSTVATATTAASTSTTG